MKVINIKGTGDKTCRCGTWLKHWVNFSHQQVPTFCPVEGCFESPTLGAHVRKVSENDYNHYIIPMCSTHNMSNDELSISPRIVLVSANKSETCELWS